MFSLRWLKARWLRIAATVALLMGVIARFMPEEKQWLFSLRTVSCEQHVALRDSAEWLSWAGNYWSFNAPLFLGLCWWGWRKQSAYLRRLAVISLTGALLAGIPALVLRGLSGRPRPTAQKDDGFYGPRLSSQMQAFPSGHAASAFGCALPLAAVSPAIGSPFVVVATGIGWSRLYLNRHHPTDVFASLVLAVIVSLPLRKWWLSAEA